MRTRLLASMLVLLLSGAESGATIICAASCMPTSPTARVLVHHHQMDAHRNSPQLGRHAHHHSPPCAECPAKAGGRLNQSFDCGGSSDIQARSETSFSPDETRGPVRIVAALADGKLTSDCSRDHSFFCASSAAIRSSSQPLLPLRI
jgi:hypothetical protein